MPRAALPQGRLHTVRQAGADLRLHHQPVYHNLNGVPLIFLQLEILGQIVDDPVAAYS